MRNKIHEKWLPEFNPEYGETNSGDLHADKSKSEPGCLKFEFLMEY